jgi:hypothetical protein
MKANAIFSNLLTSKVVLFIVFWLSFTNIIGYIIYSRFDAVIFFVLLSLIITHFSKNMVIILGVPLILVNLAVLGKNKFKEGLEVQKPDDKDKKVDGSQPHVISPTDVPSTQHVEPETKDNLEKGGFEVGRNKNKSKYNIDYSATIEDAYDELNNILGSDGIKNLTADTQNLMKQQKQLTEAMTQIQPLMQTVGPLLDQAKTMMGSMQNAGGMDQLNKMAKQFNPSAVKK